MLYCLWLPGHWMVQLCLSVNCEVRLHATRRYLQYGTFNAAPSATDAKIAWVMNAKIILDIEWCFVLVERVLV